MTQEKLEQLKATATEMSPANREIYAGWRLRGDSWYTS